MMTSDSLGTTGTTESSSAMEKITT
jgi:hypothetical protein